MKNYLLFIFGTLLLENIAADVSSAKNDLLPNATNCGIHIQNKIINGEETILGEFPWLALIKYEKSDGSQDFYCGGVLISKRYVLTAAHCLIGTSFKIVSVRLGEYDLSTDPDCTQVYSGAEKDCADPVIDVPVVEKIVHEQYNRSTKYHDIGLLRLERDVSENDFIKPICLPTSQEERSKDYEGKKLDLAGWLRNDPNPRSDVKLKLKVSVKPHADCATNNTKSFASIGRSQLCAEGKLGDTYCREIGGQSLMSVSNSNRGPQWYAAGVVSFGPINCDFTVYTRVSEYVDWIISKLKP